jgi:hypothetical protein
MRVSANRFLTVRNDGIISPAGKLEISYKIQLFFNVMVETDAAGD